MKSKLKIILPVLLIAFGGVYKFALAKPAPVPKKKIEGEVYVLPKEFLVNLESGRFAKLGVALVFHHGFTAAPAEGGHGGGSASSAPEGYGILPQEAVVRSIITDELTDQSADRLQSRKGRHKIQKEIVERLHKETDVEVEDVLFTDVAVQ
ncbi:MAG: flagellar basal body-associated FliL family protein [Solirubrobacterales bacterium]|nr:flagellar basal body-associated FliL family protein [Solirubrobacterales bacterium]